MHDLRSSFRQIRRTPLTACLAVATLGLGIAVTTAIHGVVQGVLFRDLPYPDADRIVLVWQGSGAEPDRRGPVSPPDLLDLREATSSFDALAAINSFSISFVPVRGDPEQIQLGVVLGDVFEVLGVRPLHGRLLEPADHRPIDTRDPETIGTIVLDHGFWTRHFASDPAVIGTTIRLGGGRMRVVGVLPAGFRLHMPAGSGMSTDLAGWTPLGIDAAAAPRDGAYLKVVGRLAAGAALSQARAEVERIASLLRERHADHAVSGLRFHVEPLQRGVVAHIRPILLVLGFTGVLVLLVACANAAVLLLVRFMDRSQDIAIRSALGASRARMLRQLVTESGVISLLGAGFGVLLALAAVPALLRLEPGIVPRTGAIGIDTNVLLWALASALVTALACGLGPALLVARGPLAGLLRAQRTGPAPAARRLRGALVITQVACAFALLYASASLTGTLVRIHGGDHGFRSTTSLSFRTTLPFARYGGPDTWVAFYDELVERLRTLPRVEAAGVASDLPMTGDRTLEPFVDLAASPSDRSPTGNALHRSVGPGYFASVGTAVLEGRAFTRVDRQGARNVAVVDAALAARLRAAAPGPVVGRRLEVTVHEFRAGYSVARRPVEVIGVVETVPHEHPDAAAPGTIHLPHAQYPLWSMAVVVRGAGSVPDARAVRGAVAALDAELPVQSVRTLQSLVDETVAPTRFILALIAIFAIVVVGLTAAALFGVVAEGVRLRMRELGIRLALGATPGSLVLRLLLGGMLLAAAGAVPGVLLAPATERLLGRAVTVPGTTDVRALVVAAVMLAAVAMLASIVPALRARRADPRSLLRET